MAAVSGQIVGRQDTNDSRSRFHSIQIESFDHSMRMHGANHIHVELTLVMGIGGEMALALDQPQILLAGHVKFTFHMLMFVVMVRLWGSVM
jgi:hypothetical protein